MNDQPDQPDQARQVAELVGREVRGSDDQVIGRVGQVYLDDATGAPAWASVDTGRIATSETYVPLVGTRLHGHHLMLGVASTAVAAAPLVHAHQGHLDTDARSELARHYGVAETSVWDHADDVRSADSVTPPGELSFGTGIGGTQTGRAGVSSAAGTGALGVRGVDVGPDDHFELFVETSRGGHQRIDLDEFGSPVVAEPGSATDET